jgi:glycosyltransferase involved in cell wall biosynthesis
VAIVEAMAAGLPVVSCDIGGPAEIVRHGKTGILVAPGDVAAQADALLQLSRDPTLRSRMGRAGWQRARDCYSYEREKTRLLQILGLTARCCV